MQARLHKQPAVYTPRIYDAKEDAARVVTMNLFRMVNELEGYPVADVRALARELGIDLFYPESNDRRSKAVLAACIFEHVRLAQKEKGND